MKKDKILYNYNPDNLHKYDGIMLQLKNWTNYLKKKIYIKIIIKKKLPTDIQKYKSIHFFGHNKLTFKNIKLIKNKKIIWSPIFDPKYKTFYFYKILSHIPFELFFIHQNHRMIFLLQKKIYKFVVRSNKEKNLLLNIGINKKKIKIILIENIIKKKIKFSEIKRKRLSKSILHVSTINQKRKNVKNLISLCVNNKFNLTLVGKITETNGHFKKYLKNICNKYKNIKYLGNLNDKILSNLMLKNKIFCLPSIYEGVGQSILDAASHGMQIISTDNTGLKSYLGRSAHYINPNDKKKYLFIINKIFNNFKFNLSAYKKINRLNQNYERNQIADLLRLY